MLYYSVTLVVILSLLAGSHVANAHNWPSTPSRSRLASVTIPCPKRESAEPHIQVVAGQEFVLENTMGHGNQRKEAHYWVLVKEQDVPKLSNLSTKDLDNVFKDASDNYKLGLTVPQFGRRHVSKAKINDENVKFFRNNGKKMNKDNAWYMPRSKIYHDATAFVNDKTRGEYKDSVQYRYKDSSVSGDVRVRFTMNGASRNPRYPHIIAATKWDYMDMHTPADVSSALFQIPPDAKPGNYVWYYTWGGYRDCVDVQVISKNTLNEGLTGAARLTATEFPYGNPANVAADAAVSFTKLHHTEYTTVSRNPICLPAQGGSAKQCLKMCEDDDKCIGVQMVRRRAPPLTRSLPYTVGIPFKAWQTRADKDSVRECEYSSIHKRRDCPKVNPNCRPNKVDIADDKFVCTILQPPGNVAFDVGPLYHTSTEPKDVRYYSTSWVKIVGRGFTYPSLSLARLPLPFVTTDKQMCVDCVRRLDIRNAPLEHIPDWTTALTSDCRHCYDDK